MSKVCFKEIVIEKYENQENYINLNDNPSKISRKLTPKSDESRRLNMYYTDKKANEVACRIELEMKNPSRNEIRRNKEDIVEMLLIKNNLYRHVIRLYRLSDESLHDLYQKLLYLPTLHKN